MMLVLLLFMHSLVIEYIIVIPLYQGLILLNYVQHDPKNKIVLTLFMKKTSHIIYASPCEWHKMSENIRTLYVDCFRKSVKTLLFTEQYGY